MTAAQSHKTETVKSTLKINIILPFAFSGIVRMLRPQNAAGSYPDQGIPYGINICFSRAVWRQQACRTRNKPHGVVFSLKKTYTPYPEHADNDSAY
ncbi:MAG: hypothetical protein DBX40_04295 [Clostridiales bacterium]|nr:MAG: hypothetical protein DBX40_04295 [Clostridiales bacterium]